MPLLNVVLEPREGGGHASDVLAHPPIADALDRNGVEVVPPPPALTAHDDEARGDEDVEMLHDVRAAVRREAGHDLTGGERSLRERVEDRPARPAGERPPDQVVIGGSTHVTI